MKLNLVSRILITLAAVTAFSSCAKVNYEGRVTPFGGPNQGQNKLDANGFVMTEGDKNKQFHLQFVNTFPSDTSYSWTITSKDPNVNPQDRFETLNGSAVGGRGQKTLTVQISAVNIDSLKQGTQEFSIVLTGTNNRETLNADLTLLDASVDNGNLPVLSFVQDRVQADEKEEARLALQLSRASDRPVVVEVQLRDGSARHGRDYNGFKTSSPNSEKKQTVIFPPGSTRMDLPVIGTRSNDNCNIAFDAKMMRATAQGATIVKDRAVIEIPCRLPPPPPPPVIDLVPQKFVMSEGDTKILSLQFVENFRQDMAFNWRLAPKDSTVVVTERFQTPTGSATAAVNGSQLQIEVSAVDIDNFRQGDQEFVIVLTPVGTTVEMAADLTLLDKVKEPAARYERDLINVNQGEVATAKVILSETSTLPVTLEIETQDGSARADVDYVPVKQTVVIAPGLTSIEVPVRILPQTECKPKSELSLVVTRIENAVMQNTRATISIAKDEALCKPPAPPPPVTPKPASFQIKN